MPCDSNARYEPITMSIQFQLDVLDNTAFSISEKTLTSRYLCQAQDDELLSAYRTHWAEIHEVAKRKFAIDGNVSVTASDWSF